MKKEPPVSPDLCVWAPYTGGEAKTMLIFAELIGKGFLGDFKIISCGLGAQYDFTFLYESVIGPGGIPSTALANRMINDKYAAKVPNGQESRFRWIGFGEFKFDGETLFNDVGEKKRIKDADELDLLVCCGFEETVLGENGWSSIEITKEVDRVIPLQTHSWTAEPSAPIKRSRVLPVICLQDAILQIEELKKIRPRPAQWPTIANYYQE